MFDDQLKGWGFQVSLGHSEANICIIIYLIIASKILKDSKPEGLSLAKLGFGHSSSE